ncbi:MAG: thioredoxin [Armatimonadota bacterium]
MGAVIEATDATFEQEVLKADGVVLVDFWAPGCPPCAMLAPVLEKLATEMSAKAKFVKVNAAEQRSTAAKYGIQAVPTLFIFKSGQVAESMIGYQAEQELRKRVTAAAEAK